MGKRNNKPVKTNSAAADAQKNDGKQKKSFAARFLPTFIIMFIIFTVAGTGVFNALGKVAETNPFGEDNVVLEEEWQTLIDPESPFYEAFTETKRINVLLLGVNPPLTDTIMLISFDTENKHVDVISIPRDTYYYRKGYTDEANQKINAAYKGNPVNSAKAVSDVLLGIPINYYVVIEYDGVKNIVDAMGGVPMNITVPGGMHYKDPYDNPPLVIDIPEGEQVLDGEHAVQFLRYRKGYVEGDLGRVKAQQEFMKSAFKQLLSKDILKICRVAFDEVDSDITWGVAASVASKAIGMSGDDITTYMMPNKPDPNPPYYVYPDSQGIEEMINEIYSIGTQEETTDGAIEGEAPDETAAQ